MFQNHVFGYSVKSDTQCISMFINYEIKASLRLNQRILIQIQKFRINSELSLIYDGGTLVSKDRVVRSFDGCHA